MHVAAVPEQGKTFGCHQAWNGRSDGAARKNVIMNGRCMKTEEGAIGIRNRQTALFVAGEGYRLRNVIDWRSLISEAVGRCERSANDICRRRRSGKCQGSRPTTLTKDEKRLNSGSLQV